MTRLSLTAWRNYDLSIILLQRTHRVRGEPEATPTLAVSLCCFNAMEKTVSRSVLGVRVIPVLPLAMCLHLSPLRRVRLLSILVICWVRILPNQGIAQYVILTLLAVFQWRGLMTDWNPTSTECAQRIWVNRLRDIQSLISIKRDETLYCRVLKRSSKSCSPFLRFSGSDQFQSTH